MSPAPDSFQYWLTETIWDFIPPKSGDSPYIIWCDPKQVWKELLEIVADDLKIEIWADEVHELALRTRFMQEKRVPRIIWLPRSRNEITYLKVFEVRAQKVWELSLEEALVEYGVTAAKLQELGESVAAFTRAQFDKPLTTWTNVTDRDTCDDQCILEVISGTGTTIEDLKRTDRFGIFRRRILQEFGLPDPQNEDTKSWQLDTIATLLCTEAAQKNPATPTKDASRVIRNERYREKALEILNTLMKHRDYTSAFEHLAPEAEARTSLRFWAQECELSQDTFASSNVESELWKKELKAIQSCESDIELIDYLANRIALYQLHEKGFWGSAAGNPVRWDSLILMADIAQKLHDQAQCSTSWKSVSDAIGWFTSVGWKVDQAGEMLFRDDETLGPGLLKVRTRLRAGYLRHLDKVNQVFSEIIANHGLRGIDCPFSGELIESVLNDSGTKGPVAILYLDALRYDLGAKITDYLNTGEPAQRASIRYGLAPLPAITPLGMAFALPGICKNLEVNVQGNGFIITSPDNNGNLADITKRREYLINYFAIKEKKSKAFTKIRSLLSMHPDEIKVKNFGKILIVHGDELDFEGHHDQLQLTGVDEYLDRYTRVVRMLRDGGYSTILIATDHGFFHWEPAEDEIIPKPRGKILWKSRRAIVGENLIHSTALQLQVTNSELQCMIPRSVNAFETYGGIGYFHGGVTLQELIIPIIIITYPKKVKKISAVLKPVEQITSLQQRIDVAPSSTQRSLDGTLDDTLVSRTITVKVMNPGNGELIFKANQPVTVVPGGDVQSLVLMKVKGTIAPRETTLSLRLIDDETEEVLEQKPIVLKLDLDEWD